MKFIVTGSAGFIGQALCRALMKQGAQVIGIDRKNGIEADEIEEFLSDDVNAVFHLAAQTSVFNTDKCQIIKDNIDTFISVCDACNSRGIKLVYASSSTANPENTTSMYGLSKHFDEQYAQIYNNKATGVRLHNVYGPNPRKGTLLYSLMHDDVVTLYNGGKNVRHFTYIDDAVEGLIFAMGSSKKLINVACPQAFTIRTFSLLANQYRKFEIAEICDKRVFDNLHQNVNQNVYVVPLNYTLPPDGLEKSFSV